MSTAKVYNVEGRVNEWVRQNSDKLFDDILDAAESNAVSGDYPVTVCSIRSITGYTHYVMTNPLEAVGSLKKAMHHYVSTEEYEKAARARDAIMLWEEHALIYRKK